MLVKSLRHWYANVIVGLPSHVPFVTLKLCPIISVPLKIGLVNNINAPNIGPTDSLNTDLLPVLSVPVSYTHLTLPTKRIV